MAVSGPANGEVGSPVIKKEGGAAALGRKPTDDAEQRPPGPPGLLARH